MLSYSNEMIEVLIILFFNKSSITVRYKKEKPNWHEQQCAVTKLLKPCDWLIIIPLFKFWYDTEKLN